MCRDVSAGHHYSPSSCQPTHLSNASLAAPEFTFQLHFHVDSIFVHAAPSHTRMLSAQYARHILWPVTPEEHVPAIDHPPGDTQSNPMQYVTKCVGGLLPVTVDPTQRPSTSVTAHMCGHHESPQNSSQWLRPGDAPSSLKICTLPALWKAQDIALGTRNPQHAGRPTMAIYMGHTKLSPCNTMWQWLSMSPYPTEQKDPKASAQSGSKKSQERFRNFDSIQKFRFDSEISIRFRNALTTWT